jgi:hypothetical protein
MKNGCPLDERKLLEAEKERTSGSVEIGGFTLNRVKKSIFSDNRYG